jgi:hypothetical protein
MHYRFNIHLGAWAEVPVSSIGFDRYTKTPVSTTTVTQQVIMIRSRRSMDSPPTINMLAALSKWLKSAAIHS